jgi:hypothetical protein
VRGTEGPGAVLKINLGGREMSMGEKAVNAAVLTVELQRSTFKASHARFLGYHCVATSCWLVWGHLSYQTALLYRGHEISRESRKTGSPTIPDYSK